jgi:hypothetical protein
MDREMASVLKNPVPGSNTFVTELNLPFPTAGRISGGDQWRRSELRAGSVLPPWRRKASNLRLGLFFTLSNLSFPMFFLTILLRMYKTLNNNRIDLLGKRKTS